MQVVSWNVNSIRARLTHVLGYLQTKQPDVLCLQELKAAQNDIPEQAFIQAGYHVAASGQKSYNGVAVLSRSPLEVVQIGLGNADPCPEQARCLVVHTRATHIVSLYVPNGEHRESVKFGLKLQFFTALCAYLQTLQPQRTPMALCGDFNVAPREVDVAEPRKWCKSVLFCEEVRNAFATLLQLGFVDAFAEAHPQGGMYSWWDYRGSAWRRNAGLRIDAVLLSKVLATHYCDSGIDQNERALERPSDHAPVWIKLHQTA